MKSTSTKMTTQQYINKFKKSLQLAAKGCGLRAIAARHRLKRMAETPLSELLIQAEQGMKENPEGIPFDY